MKTGYLQRIGRLLWVVASFIGATLLVASVGSYLGMSRADANGAGLMVGLVVVAYVMYPSPRS